MLLLSPCLQLLLPLVVLAACCLLLAACCFCLLPAPAAAPAAVAAIAVVFGFIAFAVVVVVSSLFPSAFARPTARRILGGCCWGRPLQLIDGASTGLQGLLISEASKGGVKVSGIFPNNSPYIRDP